MDLIRNIRGSLGLNSTIYRIFSTEYALELFRTNTITLVPPAWWDDPFENIISRTRFFEGDNEIHITDMQPHWYGQCWTTTPESDAMWHIYSPDKDGVRIKTTVGRLLNAIIDEADYNASEKYFIGKVQYLDVIEITGDFIKAAFSGLAIGRSIGYVKTLLIKRKEFEHEQEVRLLFRDLDGRIVKNGSAKLAFDVNIIDHVMIDPRSDRAAFASKRRAFEEAGCKCDIVRSDLYQVPNLLVNI